MGSSQDPASPDVGLKREVIESNTALKVTNSTTGYGRLHCEELRAHGSIYTGAEAIEVNHYGTGNRNALVDFHADDTHADYSARLIRAAGVDPDLSLTNVGNGSLRLGTVGSDRLTINSAGSVMIGTATDGMTSGGSLAITHDIAHPGAKAGFFNTSPVTKPTVTGSRGGNAALASLLTALAGLGLLVDSST